MLTQQIKNISVSRLALGNVLCMKTLASRSIANDL